MTQTTNVQDATIRSTHVAHRTVGKLLRVIALVVLPFVGVGSLAAQGTSVPVSGQRSPSAAVAAASPAMQSASKGLGENKTKPVDEETEEAAQPNDASHQGIKVHGHWKIVVKNPDGSLASTREFENSVVDNGLLLTFLLSGRATAGEPAISLSNSQAGNGPCGGYPLTCLIAMNPAGFWSTTPSCTAQQATCSYNLSSTPVVTSVQTVDNQGNPTGNYIDTFLLQLSGQIIATTSGTINTVATAFVPCFTSTGNAYSGDQVANITTISPAACYSPSTLPANSLAGVVPSPYDPLFSQQGGSYHPVYGPFTSKYLLQSIAIVAGQTIQVTVQLSFS